MGKHVKVPAALILTAGMLILAVGWGQTGDIDEILNLTSRRDLILLRAALDDSALQAAITEGFAYGPCRTLLLTKLTSNTTQSGSSSRAAPLYGLFGCGVALASEERQVRFLYDPGLRAGSRLWIQERAALTSGGGGMVLNDEIAFWFLLEVLRELPGELTGPLRVGSIVDLWAEYVGGAEPEVFLYLTYSNTNSKLRSEALILSASVLSEDPVLFGELTSH